MKQMVTVDDSFPSKSNAPMGVIAGALTYVHF